jgi:hypothetical protein
MNSPANCVKLPAVINAKHLARFTSPVTERERFGNQFYRKSIYPIRLAETVRGRDVRPLNVTRMVAIILLYQSEIVHMITLSENCATIDKNLVNYTIYRHC